MTTAHDNPCLYPGCEAAAGRNGLCEMHLRLLVHGTPEQQTTAADCVLLHRDTAAMAEAAASAERRTYAGPRRAYGRIGCDVAGCPGRHVARGLCRKHYEKQKASGFRPQRVRQEVCPEA